MADTPELKIIGSHGSHDAIRAVLASRRPCKVLDAPAGEGVLTQFLRERGWDVHSADIDAGNFKLTGVPFTSVNLNRRLPFYDSSFDAVVCANGLQRLFNPGGAIREFHRILRPDGRLYINVNNYASIDRRLRFLFLGSMDTAVNEGPVQQTIDDPEAHVRFYLLFPQLANMLAAAGFEVVDLRKAATRPIHAMLTPLAWLVKLVALFVPSARRKRDHVAAMNSSAVCPGGIYLFVEAVKK